MIRSRIFLGCLGAAGLLVSCSPCGAVQAADYDQSCSSASDCVGVSVGNFCDASACTNCVNAAINVAAQSQYQADFNARKGATRLCPCAAPPAVSCKVGVCSLGP